MPSKYPSWMPCDNVSTILGPKSEPQPDLCLRIPPEFGGQTRSDEQWVHGAPELVVEVADETRYIDLGPKLEDYERVGVREYVVRALEPDAVYWFVLRSGRFVELTPGPDGIFRSEVFPGLWLDPEALFRGDGRRLRAVVDLGCATPEHADVRRPVGGRSGPVAATRPDLMSTSPPLIASAA